MCATNNSAWNSWPDQMLYVDQSLCFFVGFFSCPHANGLNGDTPEQYGMQLKKILQL